MKKSFILIGSLYLIVIFLVIIVPKDKVKEVTILSIQEEKSLLMLSDEVIQFDIYANVKNSFLFNDNEVTNASLTSLDNQYQVSIDFKLYEQSSIEFYDETYFHIQISVCFDEIRMDQMNLVFESVKLSINYQNGRNLQIPFGNLKIQVLPDFNESRLTFTSIYAIRKSETNDSISGVVIHLYSSDNTIKLLDVTINSVRAMIKKNEIAIIKDIRYTFEDDITNNQLSQIPIETITLNQEEEVVVYLPIEKSSYLLRRFPIIITYSYLNEVDT